MKSQLDRILRSDLNQYTIAVTQRLNSIDHLEVCLTQRSNFLSEFQEMLKKQLAVSEKNKPKQRKLENSLPLSEIDMNSSKKEEENKENHAPHKQQPLHLFTMMDLQGSKQLPRQKIKQKASINKIIPAVLQNLKHLENELSYLKKMLKQNISQIEADVTHYMKRCIFEVVKTVQDRYQFKIMELQTQNQQLEHQLEQLRHNNSSQVSNLSIISCHEQPSCHYFQSLDTFRYAVEPTNRMTKNPIQIQDNKTPLWKHFTCEFGNKQTATFLHSKNGQKQLFKKQEANPVIPTLLRKQIDTQNYDFPELREILVTNSNIREGYGVCQLGNQTVYEGFWKNGKFQGKGKISISEYSYQGDFVDGKMEGCGTLSVKNWLFKGEFKKNMIDGHGTLLIGDQKIIGIWHKNKFIKKY